MSEFIRLEPSKRYPNDEAVAYIQSDLDTTERIPLGIPMQEVAEQCVGTKKAMGINDSAFIILPEDAEPGFFIPL